MTDTPQLTANEQPVADAYAATGVWPDDPHERRILDYLITSGQVRERKPATANEPPAEQPGEPGSEQIPASPDDVAEAASGAQEQSGGHDGTGDDSTAAQ